MHIIERIEISKMYHPFFVDLCIYKIQFFSEINIPGNDWDGDNAVQGYPIPEPLPEPVPLLAPRIEMDQLRVQLDTLRIQLR